MRLIKVKNLDRHILYVEQNTLEFIIKKKYENNYLELLNRLKVISNEANIPKIYTIIPKEEYIVTYEQYIQGETLDQKVKTGSFISKEEFIKYCLNLINILEKLHSNNILHKDIKPENIIVSEKGISLIDFNISRIFDEQKNKDTKMIGTEGYASPEQYGFTQTTPLSDVYSLGKTFEELLAITITTPSEFENFQGIIKKMTRLDPNDRITLTKIKEILNYERESIINIKKKSNVKWYNKYLAIIYTSKNIWLDSLATFFYFSIMVSFVSDYTTNSFVKNHQTFVTILVYYGTTFIFNRYLIDVSFPKLRKYKNKGIKKVIRFCLVSTLEYIIFGFIALIILNVFFG